MAPPPVKVEMFLERKWGLTRSTPAARARRESARALPPRPSALDRHGVAREPRSERRARRRRHDWARGARSGRYSSRVEGPGPGWATAKVAFRLSEVLNGRRTVQGLKIVLHIEKEDFISNLPHSDRTEESARGGRCRGGAGLK